MNKPSKRTGPKSSKPASKSAATTKDRAQKDAATAAKAPRPPRAERPRDPRLPAVGATIQRSYKGRVHEVTVREDGFEYEKATYRSLSQLARHITGAKSINGFLWLGLAKPRKTAPTEKVVKGTPEQIASAAKARAARAAKVAAKKASKASS